MTSLAFMCTDRLGGWDPGCNFGQFLLLIAIGSTIGTLLTVALTKGQSTAVFIACWLIFTPVWALGALALGLNIG